MDPDHTGGNPGDTSYGITEFDYDPAGRLQSKGLVHFSAGLGFVAPKIVNSRKMYLTLSEPGANVGVRYGISSVTTRLPHEGEFAQRYNRRL